MASQQTSQSDSEHVAKSTRDETQAMALRNSGPGADMEFMAINSNQQAISKSSPMPHECGPRYYQTYVDSTNVLLTKAGGVVAS